MSRRGFAWFSIIFPLPLAYFILFTSTIAPGPVGMVPAMEKMAAGISLFFSGISWCIVRSNRRSPARIDYPSLLISLLMLTVFSLYSVSGIASGATKSKMATAPNVRSR